MATFDSTLQLYYITEEVYIINSTILAATNQPIKRIKVYYKGRNTAKTTDKEADNLSTEISLYIGAWVILMINL